MSFLARLLGKSAAPAPAATPTPTPTPTPVEPAKAADPQPEPNPQPTAAPPVADKAALIAFAGSCGIAAADAEAWADGAVKAGKTFAQATGEFAAAAVRDATDAAASAKAAQADAVKAKAQSDQLAAELRDTKAKIGDAGKGLSEDDAPAATSVLAGKAAAGDPASTGVGNVTASAPLGMGGTHPFEQRVAALMRGGKSIADATKAAVKEDPDRHDDFVAFQRDEYAKRNAPRRGRR